MVFGGYYVLVCRGIYLSATDRRDATWRGTYFFAAGAPAAPPAAGAGEPAAADGAGVGAGETEPAGAVPNLTGDDCAAAGLGESEGEPEPEEPGGLGPPVDAWINAALICGLAGVGGGLPPTARAAGEPATISADAGGGPAGGVGFFAGDLDASSVGLRTITGAPPDPPLFSAEFAVPGLLCEPGLSVFDRGVISPLPLALVIEADPVMDGLDTEVGDGGACCVATLGRETELGVAPCNPCNELAINECTDSNDLYCPCFDFIRSLRCRCF